MIAITAEKLNDINQQKRVGFMTGATGANWSASSLVNHFGLSKGDATTIVKFFDTNNDNKISGGELTLLRSVAGIKSGSIGLTTNDLRRVASWIALVENQITTTIANQEAANANNGTSSAIRGKN